MSPGDCRFFPQCLQPNGSQLAIQPALGSARSRTVRVTPDMPVAELEQGSRPIRSRVRGQLSELPDHAWTGSVVLGASAAAPALAIDAYLASDGAD